MLPGAETGAAGIATAAIDAAGPRARPQIAKK